MIKNNLDSLIDLKGKHQQIFVALSMGVDSLAAFFYLQKLGYNVTALHFNHKLRKQNDLMEKKVKDLNIKHYIGYGKNLKSEKSCRDARLKFFNEAAQNSIVITGHHLDDYVESYLLNCFRGHADYRPIKLVSDFNTFKIVHPFLLTEKKDFINFVNRWKGGYLKDFVTEDETNSQIKGSRRNWIRTEILPSMQLQKVSLKKHCISLITKDLKELNYNKL